MPARILLVEDDFLVAMTMESDLAEGNYEIAGIANSADAAVKLAKETRPDLVVMDIRLVGPRDGVDAALEIFATTGIRCLFASANADAQAKCALRPPSRWAGCKSLMAARRCCRRWRMRCRRCNPRPSRHPAPCRAPQGR